MKITKPEGLILAKVLHGMLPEQIIGAPSKQTQVLIDLAQRIDLFLLVDDVDVEYFDDDYNTCSSSAQPYDPSDESDECGIFGLQLVALRHSTTKKGPLDFGFSGATSITLYVNKHTEVENVTHLRRRAHRIEVKHACGGWLYFDVTRYGKDWARFLPLDKIVYIES